MDPQITAAIITAVAAVVAAAIGLVWRSRAHSEEGVHKQTTAGVDGGNEEAQTSHAAPREPSREPQLAFVGPFHPSIASVRSALDDFRSGRTPRLSWPKDSDNMLAAVRSLREWSGDMNDPSSPFTPSKAELAREFLSGDEHRTAECGRRRAEARLEYLLIELSRPQVVDWREDALAAFLTLANFEVHWPLAHALTHTALTANVRQRSMPESWWKLLMETDFDYEKALARVMEWPPPLYRQNVIEVSGTLMNRYFIVPSQYCDGAFSVSDEGFWKAVVPQYEMMLARDESEATATYDGTVKSTKTVFEGKDVYPDQV